MKVNGNDVPYGLVLFLVSAIAAGGVSYYKIEANQKHLEDLEQRVRTLERFFSPYENEG